MTAQSAPTGTTMVLPSLGTQWRRVGTDLAYLLPNLFIGIAGFVVAIVGFSVGVGTLVIWLGLPVLAGALAAARGFAGLERRRVEAASRAALPPHHYKERRPGLGGLARSLADPQSWRDLLHLVVAFPLRVASFAIALAWTVGGFGNALYVLWEWALPRRGPDNQSLIELIAGYGSRFADVAFTTVAGLVLLLTAPFVVRGLALLNTGLARGLLVNETAALRARTRQLSEGRAAAVHAEAQTLRRVERDIHDGPQQRLVRLAMDLEAAQRRLDDDAPDRARPLLAEALEQSREALSELRAVSRGIAPPILADRGLGAALAAAAARCPVPVALDVQLDGAGARLPDAVESTAYFVVTEALTNVAKHAGAASCVVTVQGDRDDVRVVVIDDGRGGAHLGKGHGLAGLTDRLATLEGTLEVDSPAGGPTVLAARIPLTGLGAASDRP